MKINPERFMAGMFTILACFALIGLDAYGIINIGKFGYTGIGAWITLVLQFYFRKNPEPPERHDK